MKGLPSEVEAGLGDRYTAYLAAEDQIEPLLAINKQPVIAIFDRLVIVRGHRVRNPFAQNTWYSPKVNVFSSIGEAANLLREQQRSWFPYLFCEYRRGALIQDKLPYIAQKPMEFLGPMKLSPLGSYSLLSRNHLIYAGDCESFIPNGEPTFIEDRQGPPSRAYLKLWELFSCHGVLPTAGQRCFEIGAAPGGWSHVLAGLGCHVTTVDRANLESALMQHSHINHRIGDAFQVKPDEVGPIDWFFSDIICYPDKLYDYVSSWVSSGLCRNFVCTLKFQGDDHYDAIDLFRNFSGSQLVHLNHNKHELTWYWLRDAHG